MLRRPGECLASHLGEGCSSSAFDAADNSATSRWDNLAARGYEVAELSAASAAP
jgi:hypothetical protein